MIKYVVSCLRDFALNFFQRLMILKCQVLRINFQSTNFRKLYLFFTCKPYTLKVYFDLFSFLIKIMIIKYFISMFDLNLPLLSLWYFSGHLRRYPGDWHLPFGYFPAPPHFQFF